MSKNHPIPEHLKTTVSMILAAYPTFIPEDDYLPLLALLSHELSNRNLAEAICLCDPKREYAEVYHDVFKVLSIWVPSQEAILQVQNKLKQVGFEKWLADE